MIERYAEAARKYAPCKGTRVLFIAEAPPNEIERYFYFENVQDGDWLWIALMKGLYPEDWEKEVAKEQRSNKIKWLTRFQESGYRLIDALKNPISGSHRLRVATIREQTDRLLCEVGAIRPKCIVLIKKSVNEALFRPMKDADFHIISDESEFLPFPSSGQQSNFEERFSKLNFSKCQQR